MLRTLVVLFTIPLSIATVGCGDPCGPGDAPVDGLALVGAGGEVRFADLVAGRNNDCPDPNAPAGVISVSIHGTQVGTSQPITLCIPRPDLLGSGSSALGTDVVVFDASADLGLCTFRRAAVPAATGTVTASGVCDSAADPAGFALTINGELAFTRTCGAVVDEVRLQLSGTVAVAGS